MHEMGFAFVLQPILINVLLIVGIAVAFNALVDYYRYPGTRARLRERASPHDEHYPPIAHADLVYALSQIDTVLTVSEEDLIHIYDLATGRARTAGDNEGYT